MCRKVSSDQWGNISKQISLKASKKVLQPSFCFRNISKRLANSIYSFLPPKVHQMSNHFPQQVSQEQAGAERSEYVFSNGLSIPASADQASRLIGTGHESVSNRQNGYRDGRLNDYVEHVHHGREANDSYSAEVRNDRAHNATHSATPRHPEYREYNDRLRTYARWTLRRPDPHSLTQAGFYYTNNEDLVRCYQCGIGLKDFSEEDEPLKEHVRHSSSCSFLQEYLGASRLTEMRGQLQMEDPEYNRQMQLNELPTLDPSTAIYRHPEYQTMQARLSSFRLWPDHMTQTPQQLAEAGLFYTGMEDRVRCFACDGGLQRWDPDDDPWTEHCRWFPACPFARQQRGDNYIAMIQAALAMENQVVRQDLSGVMEPIGQREPELQAPVNEHRDVCVEMGYKLEDFNEAVQELRNRGTVKPTIEEIIDVIEVIKVRRTESEVFQAIQNETPAEENQRLKNFINCMKCSRNNVNALFLPCTHHRVCMDCAEPMTHCPVCEKKIRQKIRTYMA